MRSWLGGLLLAMGCARAGTAPPAAPGGAGAPLPALSGADCLKAVFPAAQAGRIGAAPEAAAITATEALALSAEVTICRIDHREPDSDKRGVEIAAVSRTSRAVLGRHSVSYLVGRGPWDSLSGEPPDDVTLIPEHDGEVAVTLLPLTATEQAVLIAETRHVTGPMTDDKTTRSKLYRVTAAGLAPILALESSWLHGEASRVEHCELPTWTPAAAPPAQLALTCEETRGDYHNPDMSQRGLHTKHRIDTYRWTGARYERISSEPVDDEAGDTDDTDDTSDTGDTD